MTKYALVFNANSPQIAQAYLFLESLRDKKRGSFQGDIWIVSSGLNELAKKYAEKYRIGFVEDSMEYLWDWPGWKIAAENMISYKDKMKESEESLQKSINMYEEIQKALKKKTFTQVEGHISADMKSATKFIFKKVYAYLNKGTAPKRNQNTMLMEADKIKSQIKQKTKNIATLRKQVVQESFIEYRNKRQSKFIFLKFLKDYGGNYSKVILCDIDILIQNSVKHVFDQITEDKLYYWREERKIHPGTSLWKKNLAYKNLIGNTPNGVDLGIDEINIGFIAGKPRILEHVLTMQKDLYLNESHIELIPHFWHEQDYYRLLKGMKPQLFQQFVEGTIIHLCNGGNQLIREVKPLEFRFIETNKKPTVVHFAGGAWQSYNSLNKSYKVDPDDFYKYYL